MSSALAADIGREQSLEALWHTLRASNLARGHDVEIDAGVVIEARARLQAGVCAGAELPSTRVYKVFLLRRSQRRGKLGLLPHKPLQLLVQSSQRCAPGELGDECSREGVPSSGQVICFIPLQRKKRRIRRRLPHGRSTPLWRRASAQRASIRRLLTSVICRPQCRNRSQCPCR
jgi:hypothetical protein